jgi:leucyl/phenylalanyl-tRNA--protein transferase
MESEETKLVNGMLAAYREGWFPMAEPERGREGEIEWFNPDPRAVIPLDATSSGQTPAGLHVSRSLRRRVHSGRFLIRSDTAFERVMRECAAQREEGSWIDERLIGAYTLLHEAGHAHSVEAWLPVGAGPGAGAALVGGVYGVGIGGAFFGESMFSRPALGGTDASKVCLVHLVHHLRRRGYRLLDAQLHNPHIERLGAVEISRAKYLAKLADAVARPVSWGRLQPELTIADLAGPDG